MHMGSAGTHMLLSIKSCYYSATGGLKAKYAERRTDHWGRNHLDSLYDKGLATTPGAWTNFDGTVPRANAMALVCNSLVG